MKTMVPFSLLAATLLISCVQGQLEARKFPDDFKFGTATAAYQIEGAWNDTDKAESIWDRLTHTRPDLIEDGLTGDVACDSFHRYEEDVRSVRDLGADYYRFSISWPRLLPTGFNNYVSPAGRDYYNNLIDALIENGVEPVVTLYHWDLPQRLQDIGGWANALIADYFQGYAKTAFELFGDRVKTWITMNEPFEVCQGGYGAMRRAPTLNFSGTAEYLCAHTLIRAHAKAYRLYDEVFRPVQKGKISLTMNSDWYEPSTNNTEEAELTERGLQFELGWYAHPIFSKEGDYPEVMKERIAMKSKEQGFRRSRLPVFTPEEINYIRGTYDFFGLNHYTSVTMKDLKGSPSDDESFALDRGLSFSTDPSWKKSTASSWLSIVPHGFTNLLKWIKDQYDNPEVYVIENGYSDEGYLEDVERISYMRQYIHAMLDAIDAGCNIKAYTVWSLMDNFEWRSGYKGHFGLYAVDFNDPNRTRTPKQSAEYFKFIFKTREIV